MLSRKKFLLLFHSVRHTRFEQLLWRLRLTARRKKRVKSPKPLVEEGRPQVALDELPRPRFAARGHLAKQENDTIELRFLNVSHQLNFPIDWRPQKWLKGSRLEILNLHYMEYLECVDNQSFQSIITSWIENNPPYMPEYWLDNWNSYSLSIRCVVWMQQFALRSKELPSEFSDRFLESLWSQIHFLSENLELDVGGNHLIKNIKTLAWAGAFFGDQQGREWSKQAAKLLSTELKKQFLDDGMHFERSPAYHVQVFVDLLECYQTLPQDLGPNGFNGTLDKMAQVTTDLAHPNGDISLFNDGGIHMAYSPQESLHVYKQLTDKTTDANAVIEMPAAGYFGIRDERGYLLVDCGRIAPDTLPAHGHGDILAFEWNYRGHPVAIDAGVLEYHPGEARAYSRSTAAHNTVTVDDQDQCEFWLSFRVGRRANVKVHSVKNEEGKLELVGSHDGFFAISRSSNPQTTVHCFHIAYSSF